MSNIVKESRQRIMVLRELAKRTGGNLSRWDDLKKIAASLGVKDEEFEKVHHWLQYAQGFIKPYGSGYTSHITAEGLKFLEDCDRMSDGYIVVKALEMLRQIGPGYIGMGVVFDSIGVRDDDFFRQDILETMYQFELIGAGSTEWNARILPKGRRITSVQAFDALFESSQQLSSGFQIIGSGINVNYHSPNASIKVIQDGDTKQALTDLINFIQQNRTEDLELLVEAVKDIEAGKNIEQNTIDRVLQLAANMVAVATPFTSAIPL